ncbi:E3 ubiquitin-protein ligase E3D [Exaiptasia diaphana]|uniref:E3 ubiquitin-protein ligase E3D n=1 Tax=Exaiptasia diaphana TaxID=2652724 RepID=A0A913XZH3_EXADI|nr:E3 ubiquitin-protein ligase E3D [Exaiptasia diaphana]KXJ23765.1 E3 ubiquitin-protein ligase E3D [Exaiptasia diaphana]
MAGEALVWADIRKNIEVLQLIISLKEQKDNGEAGAISRKPANTEITVHRSNVLVKRGEVPAQKHVKESQAKKDTCVSFQEITVDPMSCQGLSILQERELQMRLHINNSLNLSSYDASGSSVLSQERKKLQQNPVKMLCKMCGNKIIEERKFERVLELPSEHWQQTSRNLCCHGNVSNLSSLQEASFNPSAEDCFLGSYFIMVNADVVEATHLTITQGEMVIKCHRCSRPVGDIVMRADSTGETQVRGIRIYKHAITTYKDDVFRNYTAEVYLSKIIQAKLQGRANFKFLIRGESSTGDTTAYALLWILNPDSAVLTNVPTLKSKHMGFSHGHKYLQNSTDSTKANIFHGMKVLYKTLIKSKNKDLKKTAGKEVITLPCEMCIQLVIILTASTYSIPPTLRQMEGFMVGYLMS